jgi:ABC transport permease subunit
VIPAGPFDLPHARTAALAIARVETTLTGCRTVELELADVVDIDGTGAVQLARLLDRVEATGPRTHVVAEHNPKAARLIALYRQRRTVSPSGAPSRRAMLGRLGFMADRLPRAVTRGLDFIGHDAAAVPQAVAAPRSVDWRSIATLVQQIGADGLPVTSAANLLVGVIIGFLGVSQLGRFGATVYVPELVVVAHFRELGPLVTAIVVAGRSGAGLASEIATMKVSEEIDALRAMGFDPVRWLVVPRCLALIIAVPVLTWIGDVLALVGGLIAASVLTDMSPRAYALATANAITSTNLLEGLLKTPFLALAIGLIACGQGLATQGGAAAVGARTTTAVVLSIFGVIVISSLFTFGSLTMTGPRPHIVVNDLRIGWGSRVLMEHVTFDVQRGSVFTILGGSGSGKSTLLRYLIGLEQPLAGTIDIEGLGTPHRYEGVPRFGVLFQSGALFSSMTLAENLALPLTMWTPVRGHLVKELVQAKLDLVGLGGFTGHLPGEISGGMKKRAGIARAMMLEPDLLFFDEPSAGLDPITAYELDQLILTLSRDLGITIVIVTHELPSIFLVADSCIVLDKVAKGIVARGNPREVRDQASDPFVHAFFTRSSPGTVAHHGVK